MCWLLREGDLADDRQPSVCDVLVVDLGVPDARTLASLALFELLAA